MKKIFTLLICTLLIAVSTMQVSAATTQTATKARQILDKTASVVGNKGGAQANFTISGSKLGTTSGTIAIKGNMFHATTPQATVWFNGKTQWSYLKKTNEVNVTTPTEAQQMSMNPYKFINMYKSGYTLSYKTVGQNYQVHLVAQNKTRSVQELYILINQKTYKPSQVKMRQKSGWTTINISNFQAKSLSNSTFIFRSKDFPSAEVIDLR